MNYEQAMEFLEGTKKYGSRLGLAGIRRLMDLLGNVQEKIPVIHIAGTNGKGSVGAMLSSVFAEAGYRVGHFSTPDVFSYEEEFRINNVPIAKERLAEIFTEVADACRKIEAGGEVPPTRFEVETAAAYLWFYEEGCDAAVIETGMGGATDATNVVSKPVLSILTSVSLEHTQFLGKTLREIAEVKTGIIKPGCPAVSMEQAAEVEEVFRKRCAETCSPYLIADGENASAVSLSRDDAGSFFDWKADGAGAHFPEGSSPDENGKKQDPMFSGIWERIHLSLPGTFQVGNAVCVLESLKFLRERYPLLTEASARAGLEKTVWPGRFEKIRSHPDFYIDGAHNDGAVEALRETVDACLPGRKIIYIMGVLADKDYRGMIRRMFAPGDQVFAVAPPDNPRALDAETLAERLREQGVDAVPCGTVRGAVEAALREAGEGGTVLAFGSLSYLKDVKAALE